MFNDTDRDALALLRTWITQPGYPLLNVSDGNSIQQGRFYTYGSNVRNDTYLISNDSSWFVPVQVGPLASASSVPLQAGSLATASSGNAGTEWVEMLREPDIMLNMTGQVINKAATRYYRSAHTKAHELHVGATVSWPSSHLSCYGIHQMLTRQHSCRLLPGSFPLYRARGHNQTKNESTTRFCNSLVDTKKSTVYHIPKPPSYRKCFDPGFMCYRMQYPLGQQQQLIATLSNLTSQGNSSLPQLLEANAFISDALALSFAGNTDPSAILDLANALAASQAAGTGFGLFLLVQPVVEALQQLVLFAEVLTIVSPIQWLRQWFLVCINWLML